MQDEGIKAQWEQGMRGAAHAQRIGADRDINAARTPRPAHTNKTHTGLLLFNMKRTLYSINDSKPDIFMIIQFKLFKCAD